jgi:hypothetical protein
LQNILARLDFANARTLARPSLRASEPALERDSDFVRELLASMEASAAAIVGAIDGLTEHCLADPKDLLDRYRGNRDFQALFAVADGLPEAAFSGHLKVKGIVPAGATAQAAMTFAAYVMIATVRMVFFAERRGIDNLRSATDARYDTYKPVLPLQYLQLIDGYGAIRSMLEEDSVERAFSDLAEAVWSSYAPADRALAATGLAYDLLVSCGAHWRSA